MKTPLVTIEKSVKKESFGCRPDETQTIHHPGLFSWDDAAREYASGLLAKGYSIAQAVRFSCTSLKVIYDDGTFEFLSKPSI